MILSARFSLVATLGMESARAPRDSTVVASPGANLVRALRLGRGPQELATEDPTMFPEVPK